MGKLLAPGKQSAPAKRLIPVMAILAMLIPAASFALGLGNIKMNSALNQPLNAEIELLSVQRGDLDNLVVKLGTDEDFQRVGAERVFFLTNITFEVVARKDGTAYVQLNTTKTITEPFLDFVVEARWPRGRILREFTVLVDPPVLSDEAPAPVSQPAAAMQPAPAASPAQPARQAPIRARAEMAPVSRQAGELTYGPVKYNDTLFEIANQMRPSGVTVNQMMATLVRENPNAFYNGNVNQLKAGYVLRVNDPAALDAMTVAEADVEIERQHVEWQARKSGQLVRQADAPAGGRVARAGEAGAGSSMSAADQARLKLVAPGSQGAGSGAGDGDVKQLREDLLLAAEALDANRQETDELKTRLLEMEEQLEAMQRLIMLKDDEMASMQKQLGVEPVPAESEATVAEPEAAADEAAADDAAIAAMAEAVPDEGGAEAPVAEAMEEAPAAAPAPAPVAMEEPSLLDDPIVMYGGIGILVLIIAVVIQRRRKMQDGFEESILNVGGDAGVTAETMTQGGESSMVSDFAMSEMSGMSGIEADAADVDPISEADVYLAYGRHQQAEDILKEALEKEPGRNEIKLKLLEVSFAAKDREAFEQRAQEFHDALGDESDPMWAKVVTMGSQLCPSSDLFGGSSADALKEDLQESIEAGDDDLLDFDFDLDTDSVAEDSSGIDLEADDVFAELEAATGEIEPLSMESKKADDNSLDFDMDMESGLDETATAEEPAAVRKEKPADDNALDFDVSSLDFNLDADAESAAVTSAAADDGGLDFDLEGMEDLSVEEPASEEALAGELDDELEAELGDELEGELDDELEDVFGEVDEVGTKLDLAKAYVDMGDSDGARSILDEVMEEGNDDQKKQAEELLSQLA